ncbi:MAG: N-acetyl-gamma-glutamyl-phosphate reductase [Clostridia bacterium]|nr:N-acetyl-gamma-glutamyl-phosphate reductase [Clostridia bacterium]
MIKVFIDGNQGTTGLKIYDRLSGRSDVSLITLPDHLRKDISAKSDAINESDVCFLCLPDDASRESVSLVKNDKTIVIDTSTAHRVNPQFTYGFPELKGLREKIKTSKRIANPGCHASGFIALVRPLIDCGLLDSSVKLSCYSLTGYTGGGKKMIAEYENPERSTLLNAPRQYALSGNHKHLPEMASVSGLINPPCFMPVVCDFARGMQVTVPLFAKQLGVTVDKIKSVYKNYYQGKVVYFSESEENGFIASNAFSGRDDMSVSVFGNDENIFLVSRFDNLGKGASGAAIQNMNVALGLDETYGLNL